MDCSRDTNETLVDGRERPQASAHEGTHEGAELLLPAYLSHLRIAVLAAAELQRLLPTAQERAKWLVDGIHNLGQAIVAGLCNQIYQA
jgi:hypothetical protein